MDPDANLIELRDLVADLQEYRERQNPHGYLLADRADDVDRVLELFNALDQWIVNGGFLPAPWAIGQRRRTET